MTRSNRTLNRLLLLIVGLVSLALAAVLALPFAQGTIAGLPSIDDALSPLTALEGQKQAALWGAAAVAAVVIVLSLIWILTRGRGRTSTAVTTKDADIDVHVIEALLRDALTKRPEVVGLNATAHRLRGRTAVRVRVQARPGADLAGLKRTMHTAVEQLDQVIGTRLPILVHFSGGFRVAVAKESRVL